MGHPMRKSDRNRLSLDRILIETEDWTAEDWRDLHEAIDVTDVRQMVGRVGRRLEDDTIKPLVIDFVDNFSTMKKHFTESRLPQYQRFCDAKKIVEYIAEPNTLYMFDD
jgi:hypothetical protein